MSLPSGVKRGGGSGAIYMQMQRGASRLPTGRVNKAQHVSIKKNVFLLISLFLFMSSFGYTWRERERRRRTEKT
jgi:hypothetical protein